MSASLIGHNGGPPLDGERIGSFNHYAWVRASRHAWRRLPREVDAIYLRRAEELGMTYREYRAAKMDGSLPKPKT